MQPDDDARVADLLGFDTPATGLPAAVSISLCSSERASRVTQHRLKLAGFQHLLMQRDEGEKAGPSWLPAIFRGNRRSNDRAEAIGVAAFDLDGGHTVAEVAAKVEARGLAAIIATSWSHTTAHPKLRVVLFPRRPWRAADYSSRGAAARAYRRGLLALADRLGFVIDHNALDLARLFYLPRHAPGAPHESRWINGTVADVWPAASEAEKEGERVLLPAERSASSGDESTPPDIVLSALGGIRNDERFDRQGWIKVIAAVRHVLGEEGHEAAEEWSAGWTGGEHDPAEFDRVWRSLRDRGEAGAGAGTILFLARRDGWKDPRAEAERERLLALFADLPDLAEASRSAEREAADTWATFGDVSNGARHADRLRGKRLYVSATGQWLHWTRQRWAAQTAEDTAAGAKETSALLLTEAAQAVRADPSDRNRALLGSAGRLHSSSTALARMVEMSRSEPGMHVHSPADFDRDAGSITLPNGIFNLRTGTIRRARPEDHVSKLAGAPFDPDARAPMFESFLAAVLPDPDIRGLVQRSAGYTLTGSVDEEVFFVAHGTGANGKSVFANILAALLGEYAASFGSALVTKNKNENEAERMKARLPGLRLALVNETAVGDLWDSARLKELASRERMSARLLYKEGFDFWPTAKLWVRTNHLPGSLDAGDGFWRRCIPIPFTVQIPPEERIPDLDRKIIAEELAGVLGWALTGATAWARDGLQVPAVIRAEIESYREETDLLGMWLAERTARDSNARVKVSEAFADYEAFCRSLGAHSGTAMTFSRAMTAKGERRDPHKGAGARRFIGFRLRELVSDRFADDPESLI